MKTVSPRDELLKLDGQLEEGSARLNRLWMEARAQGAAGPDPLAVGRAQEQLASCVEAKASYLAKLILEGEWKTKHAMAADNALRTYQGLLIDLYKIINDDNMGQHCPLTIRVATALEMLPAEVIEPRFRVNVPPPHDLPEHMHTALLAAVAGPSHAESGPEFG